MSAGGAVVVMVVTVAAPTGPAHRPPGAPGRAFRGGRPRRCADARPDARLLPGAGGRGERVRTAGAGDAVAARGPDAARRTAAHGPRLVRRRRRLRAGDRCRPGAVLRRVRLARRPGVT